MRAVRTVVITLMLATACSRDRGSPSKIEPLAAPRDAAAADAPAEVSDAPSAHTQGLAFQPLPLETPLPDGAKTGAALVGGARWIDRGGRNTLYLIERASADRTRVALYAVLDLGEGIDRLRLRELKDQASCALPSPAAFDLDIEVSDLDGDGDSEVWFGYLVGCGDDDTPMQAKQFVLEGRDKYVVRGDGPLDGKPEPAAASWPPGWLDHAIALYEGRAARIDAHPAAAEPLDVDDFADIEIDRPSDDGVPIRVTYPDLSPLPAAMARDLTARMRTFLRADARHDADLVGSHDGDCAVTLAVPELVSISCRHLIDLRTRRQQAEGTGGAPGDYTRDNIVVWRAPGLPAVTLDELASAAVMQARCGSTAPRALWVIERDGLRWLPDAELTPPTACADGIDWSDLRPTSARARAVVTRMLPSSDP